MKSSPIARRATMMGIAVMMCSCAIPPEGSSRAPLHVTAGPAIPDLPGIGYAGGYGGASGQTLLFAGGTNFPDAPPWKNGRKVWYDSIYALSPGAERWRIAGRLPIPLAGGASVEISEGVLCIGGTDDSRARADVLLLRMRGDDVIVEAWPSLPSPRASFAAAVVGRTVYVVGGHEAHGPLEAEPLADVLALDLDHRAAGWRRVAPLPGPGRWLPVVASDGKSLFVLSGMVRRVGETPAIGFLRDVYRLTPTAANGNGAWSRLPDLPRAVSAAPSPAPIVGSQILLFGGGVDTADIVKPMDARDPLDATVRAYDVETGATEEIDARVNPSVVVAAVARRGEEIIILSGEVQAGVRTPTSQLWRIERAK